MGIKVRNELALNGVAGVLRIDVISNEVVDLYLPEKVWRYLHHRFGGNKMTVTLRGPHDYTVGLITPPEIVMTKLKDWIANDGTLNAIIDIVEEVTDADG